MILKSFSVRIPRPNESKSSALELSRIERACTKKIFKRIVEENHLEAEALACEKLSTSVNLFAFSR